MPDPNLALSALSTFDHAFVAGCALASALLSRLPARKALKQLAARIAALELRIFGKVTEPPSE